jgi:hypothetical protein
MADIVGIATINGLQHYFITNACPLNLYFILLTFEKIKAGKKLLLSFDYKCNDTT